MCFWNVSFSPPGHHLGAQAAREVAKRELKVIEKEVRRHFGQVPGRVQEAPECSAKASSEGS